MNYARYSRGKQRIEGKIQLFHLLDYKSKDLNQNSAGIVNLNEISEEAALNRPKFKDLNTKQKQKEDYNSNNLKSSPLPVPSASDKISIDSPVSIPIENQNSNSFNYNNYNYEPILQFKFYPEFKLNPSNYLIPAENTVNPKQSVLELQFYGQTRLNQPHFNRNSIGLRRIVVDQGLNNDSNEQSFDSRNLIEEGFYVGSLPSVRPENLLKLEGRMVREDLNREIFFDKERNNQLIIENSPLTELSIRPINEVEYQEPRLFTHRIPSIPIINNIHSKWMKFKLNVNNLKFNDHPYFTLEDLYCKELETLVEEFKRREIVNLGKYYKDKIKPLRIQAKTIANGINEGRNGGNNDKIKTIDFAKRLLSILMEIVESRQSADREEYELRLLFKAIYNKWIKIREIRTNITQLLVMQGKWKPNLVNNKENLNTLNNSAQFESVGDFYANATTTTNNITGEINNNNNNEAFNSTATGINQFQNNPTTATIPTSPTGPSVPSASTSPSLSSPLDSYIGYPLQLKVKRKQLNALKEKREWKEDYSTECEEQIKILELRLFILNQGDELNEKQIIKLNEEIKQIKLNVEQRMKKQRKFPGKPSYSPIIDNRNISVTSTEKCLVQEQKRRELINTNGIHLILLINNQIVRKTPVIPLNHPKYECNFNFQTDLRLITPPRSIILLIQQSFPNKFSSVNLGEILIPIPEYNQSASTQTLTFSGARIDNKDLNTVVKEETADSRYIHGSVEAEVYWEVNEESKGNNSSNSGSSGGNRNSSELMDLLSGIDRFRVLTRKKMVELSNDLGSKFDPNDPRNSEIIELMRRQRIEKIKTKTFKAKQSNNELLLTNENYFIPSARRKILKARNESQLITSSVPLNPAEINENLFQLIEIEDLIHAEEKQPNSENKDKNAANNQLLLSNMHIRSHWYLKAKLLNYSLDYSSVGEIVNESPLPDFNLNLGLFDYLFAARRKLKVQRKQIKTIKNPKSCSIIVQIIKASNLPQRTNSNEIINSFIEIEFQSNKKKTTIMSGNNPNWNEIISLPLNTPAESFSPAHLAQINENIQFNLFDSVTSIQPIDSRLQTTKLKTTQIKFIGGFSLPFATIYQNTNIQGEFQLNIPNQILGYSNTNTANNPFSTLSLYITLDPLLSLPPPKPINFLRSNPFYSRCQAWVDEIKASFPLTKDRLLTPIVSDINNNPQLVCRFLCPQRPPLNYDKPTIFTRFVAEIPFLEDNQAIANSAANTNIWCLNNEFLGLAAGDWEEHACLLANYFIYNEKVRPAGWETFVILGEAFPEGKTAYVLRLGIIDGIIKSEIIYNPCSGESWNLRDDLSRSLCPLQSIGCVFNQDNIWANIQLTDNLTRISFSLNNLSYWRPLFHSHFNKELIEKEYQLTLNSIEKPINYYSATAEYYISRANRLERLIERAAENWRENLKTRWDYGINKIFRENLEKLELEKQKIMDSKVLLGEKQLQAIYNNYDNIYGFPMHFNESGEENFYSTNFDANLLLKSIKNTRIFELESPHIVFSLAVYIHPYPNRIGAIWVYLAALTEK